MSHAEGLSVTLHRAFDMCRDPYQALDEAIALGVNTILTSGQKQSAWEGRALLVELIEKADGRIDMYAEADYSENTTAYMWITNQIRRMAQRIRDTEKTKIRNSASGTPKHLV